MRVLVTGATGGVGRSLVSALLARGANVRAMTRRPLEARLPDGVEVVEGTLTGGPVPGALDGIDGVFLNIFGAPEEAAAALAENGVSRAVLLSSITAGTRPHLEHARRFRHAEDVLAARVPFLTVLRPGAFMSNFLWWRPELEIGDSVAVLATEIPVPMIAPEDVAEIAARVLLDPRPRSSTITMTGPESLTAAQQAAPVSRRLQRTIRPLQVTVLGYLEEHPDLSKELLTYLEATLTAPLATELDTKSLAPLLGHPPLRLDDWISIHRAEFPA